MLIDRQRRTVLPVADKVNNRIVRKVSYQYPKFCNEQTGMETSLMTVFEQTQWEEHQRYLEGEISTDILKEVCQVGNFYLSSRTWCQHLDEVEGIIKKPPKQQNILLIFYGVFATIQVFQ